MTASCIAFSCCKWRSCCRCSICCCWSWTRNCNSVSNWNVYNLGHFVVVVGFFVLCIWWVVFLHKVLSSYLTSLDNMFNFDTRLEIVCDRLLDWRLCPGRPLDRLERTGRKTLETYQKSSKNVFARRAHASVQRRHHQPWRRLLIKTTEETCFTL